MHITNQSSSPTKTVGLDAAKSAAPLISAVRHKMTISSLIDFEAIFPENPESRMYNVEYLAEQFTNEFNKNNITILEQDIWNDYGWNILCVINEVQFDMFFAKYFDNSKWELTIEPANQPGLIAKLLGKKSKPYMEPLKILTSSTFNILNKIESVSSLNIRLTNKIKNEVDNPEKLIW